MPIRSARKTHMHTAKGGPCFFLRQQHDPPASGDLNLTPHELIWSKLYVQVDYDGLGLGLQHPA